MNKPMTLNVRVTGALSDFVAANVGANGDYENVSEYVRDLIRRDKERVEGEAFQRLKAELGRAFAAPDASFAPLDADEFLAAQRRA
jgi:putative addiction module CopG family antidote